jgi:hypothetical protein
MAEAVAREFYGDMSCPIQWGTFIHNGRTFESDSVYVGKMPEKLVEIGFGENAIYDKKHFCNSMYDLDGTPNGKLHGHGMDKEDMLSLPRMLRNPVAIVSADMSDKNPKDYALSFICADKKDGEQVYRRVVVQPRDYNKGVLDQYKASKVITFYNIEKNQFDGILQQVLDGKRSLVYFDPYQFHSINSQDRFASFESMGAYSTQIAGHYRTLDNLARSMANYQRTVGAAAYVELERYAEGIQFDYRQTFYTPFRDAVRTIESMEASIDELAEAREIINRACDLVKDSEIEKKVLGRIEVPYAMAYLNAMGQEEMSRKIDEAVQTISNLQINTENDIANMYDVIDRLEKVFSLNFSENSLERNQYVQEAEQLNKAFVQELKLRLGDKAMEKEDLFYEQSEFTQNLDDC